MALYHTLILAVNKCLPCHQLSNSTFILYTYIGLKKTWLDTELALSIPRGHGAVIWLDGNHQSLTLG
jgi:hypothetical protein